MQNIKVLHSGQVWLVHESKKRNDSILSQFYHSYITKSKIIAEK
jgi:hypothetical protein